MNKQYTLEAAPVASTKELKNQKTPKAKRIAVGTDVHLRGYQAARKVDNAAIGAVANFRSETELLLYVDKQCEQAEEVCSAPNCFVELASKYFVGKEDVWSDCFVDYGQIIWGS